MPGLFQKPNPLNSLFPEQVSLPGPRPLTGFEKWQSDPINLAKINQDPAQAGQMPAPQPASQEPVAMSGPQTGFETRTVAPQAPNLGPMPSIAAPSQPPAFDASAIMPKRPEQPQLSRGQNIGMAMATIADSIGSALNHSAPTVGPQRLQRMNDVDVAQRAYDQNAPKLQYDLKQKVTSDALGNAAMAAGTAHTRQVTQSLQGQMSPVEHRKADFLDEWSKQAQSGQYSPDALKAAARRAASYHKVDVTDQDLDAISSGGLTAIPKFEFKSGAIEPITYKGVRYGPKATAGEPAEVAAARKEAQDALNQSIDTDKKKGQNKVNIQLGGFGAPGDPMIDMVGQGRVDLATALSRIPPAGKKAFSDQLAAKYPEYSQSDYGVEKDLKKSFTSGDYSKQLNAINTAREHMGTFKDLAKALNSNDTQAINRVSNAWTKQFGGAAPINFEIAKAAFSGEVGKSFAGANVAQADREELAHQISSASSLEQLMGAAETADKLLEGKQHALKQTYDSGMSGKPNFGNPQSHTFSVGVWQTANPHGDVEAAKAAAVKAGYEVVR